MTKPTKTAEQLRKTKKSSEPDMGSYDPGQCKEYVRDKTGHSQKMSSSPVPKYYDIALKRSKNVPPPNQYKITQEHYKRVVSKSPPSIRVKRHWVPTEVII